MTDLAILSNYKDEDVNLVVDKLWNRTSKKCSKQEKPQLCLVGGQPGAGKSSTINNIANSLNKDFIAINYDEYRRYHPNAIKLYEKGSNDDYSFYTNKFMKAVGEKIINRAIENNYNVILEKTMNNSSNIKKELDKFVNYDINISVVTCSKENSSLSVETRFSSDKARYLNGNKTPPRHICKEYQEKCCSNLGKTIQEIAYAYKDKIKNISIIYRNAKYQQKEIFNLSKGHNIENIDNYVNRIVFGKKAIENILTKEMKSLENTAKKFKPTNITKIKDRNFVMNIK